MTNHEMPRRPPRHVGRHRQEHVDDLSVNGVSLSVAPGAAAGIVGVSG
ncbi:hypothetical protein [Streptomyces sp. 3214.6]|nr:hypothetical protein [Streptomyces sp. 3214.6]